MKIALSEHRWAAVIFPELHDPERFYSTYWTWTDMLSRFSETTSYPYKADAPLWSPIAMKEGADRRGKNSVSHVTMAVADVDDGTRLSDLAESEGLLSYTFIAHTSWSHSDDHPKFRVIFPLSEPVPSELWPRTWKWLQRDVMGGHCDPQCKDASRMYYLPAVPEEGEPTYRSFVNAGELLEPQQVEQIDPVVPPYRIRPGDLRKPGKAPAFERVPSERARWGKEMAMVQTTIGTCKGGTCPRCGRRSVWFKIEPEPDPWARCNHRNSCGWWGRLRDI